MRRMGTLPPPPVFLPYKDAKYNKQLGLTRLGTTPEVWEMASAYGEMERKWQKRWSDRGLNLSDRDESKPKFMLIFAYPGVTGYLHVGHMRGFSYVDAIGRYKRMTGYNVMFPVGTHATGNGSISLAEKIRRRDPGTVDYLLRNGCPEEKVADLTEPMDVVRFFNDVYVNEYWKRFGFLADWRRFTCTLFPDYARFIQWQFRKLHDRGLLIQKPYFAPACPSCGPVAVDASETDISKGGSAETQEYTLLKFRHGDEFLVAATLRPETVYGQVCFWVNPDVEYVRVMVGGETWVVSPQAAEKLSHQKEGVETVGTVPGRELIGWMCTAPMIHRDIPVFPARFCDPDVGTGLVTSVPSDAPDDWISLEALKSDTAMAEEYGLSRELIDSVVPIPIIDMEGYGRFPAKDIIDRMGITAPGDPKLVEAKKQVYKDGYHMGRMNAVCGEYAGLKVDVAKDRMKQAMLDAGEADVFYDLTEEVVCRCGKRVFIRRIDDQWFINYADKDLTERTAEHCSTMGIMPSEYYRSAEALDSFVGAVNAVSRKLADAGLRFAYHNHAFEFLPFEGGGRLIDILAERCPDLDFIFDIYWCRYAGFDPAAEMKKLSGRIRHIHLKDGFSFFRIPVITAVGRGRLDIPSVLSAAAECGTKYAYFEHDFTPDPYKFTRKSFAAVRKIPGVELRV